MEEHAAMNGVSFDDNEWENFIQDLSRSDPESTPLDVSCLGGDLNVNAQDSFPDLDQWLNQGCYTDGTLTDRNNPQQISFPSPFTPSSNTVTDEPNHLLQDRIMKNEASGAELRSQVDTLKLE